jgi:hypothetical protein
MSSVLHGHRGPAGVSHCRTAGDAGELIVKHGLTGSRYGADSLRLREDECGPRRDPSRRT